MFKKPKSEVDPIRCKICNELLIPLVNDGFCQYCTITLENHEELLKQDRENYKKLLGLALTVKQENTPEFMEYWNQEIQTHLDFLKVEKISIGTHQESKKESC